MIMADRTNFSSSRAPILRQLMNADLLALGQTAASRRSESLSPRTKNADRVVGSVCPYCAVGCGQLVYVKDEKIIDIEGDPARRFRTDACAQRARRRFNW